MPLTFDLGSLFHRTGSAPEPFNAINGPRLAGPQGSHPLHTVVADELVLAADGGVSGEIVLDGPATVGEGITGSIRVTATKRISARKASLRLVGLRLDEVTRSEEHRDGQGHVTSSEHWVEVHGTLFTEDAYLEPAVPAALEPGQEWQARFAVPAPPLGPPTAHLGELIIAWALEVRWDVAFGDDPFVATHLPVAQHPDLLRAGVGRQGGVSLMQAVSVGDATIGITSDLPVRAGTEMAVSVRWPSAPGGQGARVELHRRTNAPNGMEGIIASAAIDPAALGGGIEIPLLVPAGSAPSFDGAGLEIRYVIRILVDRRLRTDAAIERPIAIV